MQDLSGQTLKGCELPERIGAGGFGAVYKAVQTTIGRPVAIKIGKLFGTPKHSNTDV